MNFLELRELRKKYKLTQKVFAEYAGCTQQQVCKWERGVNQLSDMRLSQFYKIFGDYDKD